MLPPTIHPDTGAPYRWSGSESLEDVEPHELPTLPADIAEQDHGGAAAVRIPSGTAAARRGDGDDGDGNGDSPHRQLNNAALANLDAWVPALMLYRCRATRNGGYEAVPIWRPSTTGREPEKRHRNLKIVPEGIRDFGADQGYTPLDLVMAACDCDLDTAFRFLSERPGLDRRILICPDCNSRAETRETVEPSAPSRNRTAPIDELERFTIVPGAVGEIVDWIVATSRRPSRVLALGAAVTIVGTLIGRRVAGPTRSATHLYAVGVAPTGNGKQRPLDSVIRLLEAAGALDHFGPSKFFSLSAVLELMQQTAGAVRAGRDRGIAAKSITSRKASNHEKAVSQILRTLWGCLVLATCRPPAWAQRARCALSIVRRSRSSVHRRRTNSTPRCRASSVANGFLNRFLVLTSAYAPRSAIRKPIRSGARQP